MRTWARRSLESAASSALGTLRRAGDRRPRVRVGWVAADTLSGGPDRLTRLHTPVSMRITNTALWINANSGRVRNELYRRGRRYDVVVFFKAMDERSQEEARRIQAAGGKVVFDANVNYYEIWGEYGLDGTEPTPGQQAAAIEMTRLADHVVADSSYLLDVVRKHNDRAAWIPDNVDLRVYHGRREHRPRAVTRLVWSGMAHKAAPLLDLAGPLAALSSAELVVCSNEEPPALAALREAVPVRFVRFSDRRYAATLRGCDVIVSPKRLTNAYELGHTEYKITLGMAVGLPAVASPQQSYVEAISHAGGGVVCEDEDEWREALGRLCDDPVLRADLGARARRTVVERYSTPVTARAYLDVIESLAA